MDNSNSLNPDHKDYNSFLYDAICVALDKKAKAKTEKQVAEATNTPTPTQSQVEMMFDGGAVSTPKRKKKKQPYMSAGLMSQMRLQDGMAEIICRHMRAAQLDGLGAMDSWDCEYVRRITAQ